MKKLVALAVLVVAGGLAAVLSAVADDTICSGILPPGTYDNVVVLEFTSCTISGSSVMGNVKALEDAELLVVGSTVRGNVDGDKAEVVQIVNSTVGGNITIKEGETPEIPGSNGTVDVGICGVTVGGQIHIEKMTGSIIVGTAPGGCPANTVGGNISSVQENVIPAGHVLSIVMNSVAQNLQVFNNTGPGLKTVLGNMVGENLQCKENKPEPPQFIGGPNMAGKAEGQCFQAVSGGGAAGTPCTAGSQCLSGSCTNGTCDRSGSGGACRVSTDCEVGKICESGRCGSG